MSASALIGRHRGAGGARAGVGGAWIRRLLGTAVAAGLAVMVGAELLLAHLPANPPMPLWLAFPLEPPLVVLSLGAGEDRIAALGRALPPNIASLYGLTDARIYSPMAPARYLALLAPITAAWWGEMPELGAPRHPLYRALGVRYLLVAPGERLRPPWQLVLDHPSGWVYRQSEVWPRLFTTAAAGGSPQTGTLTVTHLNADDIAAVAGAPRAAGMLAGSLYQDGQWRLLIDGRRSPAPAAAGGLLAAPLPLPAAAGGRGEAGGGGAADEGGAGGPGGTGGRASRINLLYRPRGFVGGMLCSALACAALLAGMAPRTAPSAPPPEKGLQ